MTSQRPDTAGDNAEWFGRRNAFDFLARDADNVLRLQVVEKLLADPMGQPRLLDLGCGDGRVGERLSRLGYRVTGMDVSEQALAEAAERGITPLKGDVSSEIPVQAGNFDVVFAGEIIEHLFDTRAFLAEVRRVLKPGGKLVLTTPNLAHLPDRFRLLLGRAPMQVQPLHPYLKLHIRPFAPGTLKRALAEAGLDVQELSSTLVVFRRDPREPEQVRWASRWLAKLVPSLGSFLIVVAYRR